MSQAQQPQLAPEADAELQKYRGIQEEIQRLREQEQRLLEQNNENSMLKVSRAYLGPAPGVGGGLS